MSGRSQDAMKGGKGNTRRTKAKGTSFGARLRTEGADWALADPDLLARVITRCAEQGGALRFGNTSDGGAYAIALYWAGDVESHYVRPGDDINHFLRELAAWLDEQ